MADVVKRIWRSGPRKVKRVAWGFTLQVNGKQVRRFNGAWSEADAQKAMAAAVLDRDAPALSAGPPTRTLDELAGEYLDFKRAKGKRSLADDALALTRRIVPWFGAETLVTEMTALRIAQYDRERSAGLSRLKRPVTPATVNRELALIRHMLRLGEEWGYLDKAPRVRMGKEPEGRLRFLSEDEAVRLLKAAGESQNPYLTAIVTTGLHTGMRRGEILGLAWERVDFARGVLLVERTKSSRRREIPMNRAVYDVLEPLAADARRALPAPSPGERRRDPEGLIFRKKASGAAWGSIRTAFERACVEAKVFDFRFHDLRHTCASWLVMRGRSLKEVQELLGHQTFAMTLRYAHLSPERLRQAVASLEDFSTTSAQRALESSECAVSARRAVSSDR